VGCDSIKIYNSEFYQGTANGVHLGRSNNTRVYNNTFRFVEDVAISLGSVCVNNIIEDNEIYYCEYGISFGGSKSWGTTWEGVSYTYYFAPVGTVIRNNTFHGCTDYGVDAIWGNFTSVISNSFIYCGIYGIGIEDCRDSIIKDNTIDFCGTGVYVEISTRTTIRDNQFRYSGEHGIEIQSSYKNRIRGNLFIGSGKRDITGVFGAFYMSNTIAEILIAWIGPIYFIILFYILKAIKDEKYKKKTGKSRRLRNDDNNWIVRLFFNPDLKKDR
jgi:parallel beta-helix repeat protein